MAARKAECGYLIPENLEQKINSGRFKRSITVFSAPSTVTASLSTEVVFSELAAIRNKDILEDYVEQGAAFDALGAAGSPERKKASGQAGDLYKERMEDGSTFRFEYVYTYSPGQTGNGSGETGHRSPFPRPLSSPWADGRVPFYHWTLQRGHSRRGQPQGAFYPSSGLVSAFPAASPPWRLLWPWRPCPDFLRCSSRESRESHPAVRRPSSRRRRPWPFTPLPFPFSPWPWEPSLKHRRPWALRSPSSSSEAWSSAPYFLMQNGFFPGLDRPEGSFCLITTSAASSTGPENQWNGPRL